MSKIYLLLLLLLPLGSASQSFTISEPLYMGNDNSYNILPDLRGNILLFRDQKGKFKIQAFDSKMMEKWDKEIELDKRRPEIIDVLSLDGDFCIIYQYRHRGDQIIKAHKYNPAANLVDSVTIMNFGTRFFPQKFEVVVSEDKKIALIYLVEHGSDFTVLSFDMQNMRLLWEKSFSPDRFIWYQEFEKILVDNRGNMYSLIQRENRKSKIEDHRLEVIVCGEATLNEIKLFNVPMKGHLIYDINMTFDNLNNALSGGGFYTRDNPLRAEGYFVMRVPMLDTDNSFLDFREFEDEFINILQEKEKVKNKGISDVEVQQVVLRRDGGIILIGELNRSYQRGGTTSNYYSRMGVRPIVDYFYDDVFVIASHPSGEEHWKIILHKKQYSQGDDALFSSFFLAKTPSNIRLIFNEEISTDNQVSEFVIQGNGHYDRHAIMSTERLDLALRFKDAVQMAPNEIIVPSERRNQLKLVRITY